MKNKLKIASALAAVAIAATPAVASAGVIESVDTTEHSKGTIYHVTPTQEGRTMGSSGLNYNPNGDMADFQIPTTASLRNQLVCHIIFAGSKSQWNLEEWRPAVSQPKMIATQCNP